MKIIIIFKPEDSSHLLIDIATRLDDLPSGSKTYLMSWDVHPQPPVIVELFDVVLDAPWTSDKISDVLE